VKRNGNGQWQLLQEEIGQRDNLFQKSLWLKRVKGGPSKKARRTRKCLISSGTKRKGRKNQK